MELRTPRGVYTTRMRSITIVLLKICIPYRDVRVYLYTIDICSYTSGNTVASRVPPTDVYKCAGDVARSSYCEGYYLP